MKLPELIQQIDAAKAQIDALRPINPAQEQRVLQKFRLDWNYHSNALEGNTLTLGETRAFLFHGLTAQGKPFRDYLDIEGHKDAIQFLEEFVHSQQTLAEIHIRELHRILLVKPYYVDAVTPEGQPTQRLVTIGQYKTTANSVRTSAGAIHYYASSQETPALMGDLMQWLRRATDEEQFHPLIVAATFHYRFVSIHPFDDGNGRMARLLMNLLLMQHGYPPVVILTETKAEYLLALEEADTGELEAFILLLGQKLHESCQLFLRGIQGENIDAPENVDESLKRLQERLATYEATK